MSAQPPRPAKSSLRSAFGEATQALQTGLRVKVSAKQRGIALLMTMAVTAILSALSIQFSYNLRANFYMTGNLEASTQAYFNARSGMKIALLAVNAKQNFPQVQRALGLMGGSGGASIEIWQRACDFVNIFATGKAEFFGTTMLDFTHERAVGARSLRPDVPAFTCTVTAEDSRVNLNRAAIDTAAATAVGSDSTGAGANRTTGNTGTSGTTGANSQQGQKASQLYIQLGGMLQPMIAQELFKDEEEIIDLILNVIDWTDGDSVKSDLDPQGNFTAGSGGEPDYGRYGYESKNAKMDTVGELQLVEGMSGEVYCQIRDKLTVFSTDKINVNDADLAVLKGILCQSIQDEAQRLQLCYAPGLSGLAPIDDALLAMETCRSLKKQVYSTPFTSMSRFTQFFQQFHTAMGTGIELPLTASVINQQLGVRTKMVRIESTGVYGDTKRKMVSVVDTSTGALVHFHYE